MEPIELWKRNCGNNSWLPRSQRIVVRGKLKRQKIDFLWKKGFQYFVVEMLHVAEVKAIKIEQENTMKIHINNNHTFFKK